MARRKSYHHGDLRQALLDAGLAMLEDAGLEGLSLRKLAVRVGVSHAAPEHHFATLKHLLTAMAREGFARFEKAMRDGMAASPADAAGQLRGASRGYLAFATAHPHLFRLMFNATLLDWSDPALGASGASARGVLSEICLPVARARGLDTAEGRAAVEHLVWSQIHGSAHLVIDGKVPLEDADGCEVPMSAHPQQFDMAYLLLGQLVGGPVGA